MYSLISQECHYYSLAVKLERYVGSCNTLNGFSNKVYVPNKTEGSNRSNFNVITGINESKTLTKYISCKFKVNLIEENVIQINCGIMINVDVSIKTSYICKNQIWKPSTCSCKNEKHLASIMDDSTITCDEVIESYDEKTKFQ